MNEETVRSIAICVFRKDSSIFVAEGYDKTKDEIFYRPLGGTIEFGEYGNETVALELREEIGAAVTNVRYLGTLENIFVFEGRPGHELVLVFEGDFIERSFYEKKRIEGVETTGSLQAVWKPLDFFLNSETSLYPDGLLALLTQHWNL
ncbi:MAG TPA: NUDIX domain-containing protein [Candidatus Bathyarchaeia archaeon]|nr:NUDIX domain-containing protein [Candidatus Bathyarchaeia archaeon]